MNKKKKKCFNKLRLFLLQTADYFITKDTQQTQNKTYNSDEYISHKKKNHRQKEF